MKNNPFGSTHSTQQEDSKMKEKDGGDDFDPQPTQRFRRFKII